MSYNMKHLCKICQQSAIDENWVNILLTVISGVLVFILGQLFIEYFLKPIQEYKQLRAKISYSLTYYADLYMNPIESNKDIEKRWDNGSQKMRELSAEVRSTIELRPFGNIFIPKKKKLVKVAENLMGISYGFFITQGLNKEKLNNEYRNQIYKLLNIKGSSSKGD